MSWQVEVLDRLVEKELDQMPPGSKADIIHIIELIELHGLPNIGWPHVRQVQGKLWEIRARGPEGIGRALYVAAKGQRVVILHAIVKKTQKTPIGAIRIASKRAKEVEE